MATKVWWENLMERDILDDLVLDGRIFRRIVKKREWRAWIGLIWLRIGTSGGLL